MLLGSILLDVEQLAHTLLAARSALLVLARISAA